MEDVITLELPADLSAPKAARDALARWGVNAEADVVVSELVTNAVKHGTSPIVLVAVRMADRVRVEVRDERPDVGGPQSDSAGLRLVDAFSLEWGVRPVPGDGKVVFAEFPP